MRCFYCIPEEEYQFTPASKLTQADEIEALAKIFVAEGINKIRLTGGEPLVRKDAGQIIGSLGKLPVELTLTKNATRIHEFLPALKEANVKTVNVSLNTLQPEKFLFITRCVSPGPQQHRAVVAQWFQCKNKYGGDEGL